jgi:hypothetical protein
MGSLLVIDLINFHAELLNKICWYKFEIEYFMWKSVSVSADSH